MVRHDQLSLTLSSRRNGGEARIEGQEAMFNRGIHISYVEAYPVPIQGHPPGGNAVNRVVNVPHSRAHAHSVLHTYCGVGRLSFVRQRP